MPKVIQIVMDRNKDMTIFINREKKFTINNDRSIRAEEIYNAIDYQCGDRFTLMESINESERDLDVLEEFESLLKEIIEQLNKISTLNEQIEIKEKEEFPKELTKILE